MRGFTRTPDLPATIRRDWRASLPTGAPTRVLTAAQTTEDWLIVSFGLLSIGSAPWQHLGWNEIEHGGWNDELHELYWTTYDNARRHHVQLEHPGRVPELFSERVQASIVLSHTILVTEDRGIVISGRRTLARSGAPLEWHATLQRGLAWSRPGIRETADAALARLRAEYDPE